MEGKRQEQRGNRFHLLINLPVCLRLGYFPHDLIQTVHFTEMYGHKVCTLTHPLPPPDKLIPVRFLPSVSLHNILITYQYPDSEANLHPVLDCDSDPYLPASLFLQVQLTFCFKGKWPPFPLIYSFLSSIDSWVLYTTNHNTLLLFCCLNYVRFG